MQVVEVNSLFHRLFDKIMALKVNNYINRVILNFQVLILRIKIYSIKSFKKDLFKVLYLAENGQLFTHKRILILDRHLHQVITPIILAL